MAEAYDIIIVINIILLLLPLQGAGAVARRSGRGGVRAARRESRLDQGEGAGGEQRELKGGWVVGAPGFYSIENVE